MTPQPLATLVWTILGGGVAQLLGLEREGILIDEPLVLYLTIGRPA